MRCHLIVAALCAVSVANAAKPVLRRGWNLGNTLELYPPRQRAEWMFSDVKAQGFDWVRIPVQWDRHTGTSPPYTIDAGFLSDVNETVHWALQHGLVAMLNTHHENWFDNTTLFSSNLERFESIWQQIAHAFSSVPDEQLVYEVLNEPNHISIDQLNQMNGAVLPIIRATNPTRQVHFR